MPIHCPIPIGPLSKEEFEAVDSLVMRCAYASQNSLGRLCEEQVYENDLAARLRAEGLKDVFTQVPLTVSHGTFKKTYRLDLVVNQMVYELKAVESFVSAHDAQVYHYAALLGIPFIKLLNFGATSVNGRLRASPFVNADRFAIKVDRNRWRPLSDQCQRLGNDVSACFREWGGFLDARLFNEALVAFNGGDPACVRRLQVSRGSVPLGHHTVQMHSEDCGFLVTSMSGETAAQESHLRRLLQLLPLRGWQWINIHHNQMRLVTLGED